MVQTTIQVSKETREKLKNIGSKGQTYDEIIEKLLDKDQLDTLFYGKSMWMTRPLDDLY